MDPPKPPPQPAGAATATVASIAATAARLIGSKQGPGPQGQQQQRLDPLRSGAIFQSSYRQSLQSPMPR